MNNKPDTPTDMNRIASVLSSCDACAVFSVNEEGVAGERWRGADDKLAARFRETRFTLSEAAAFAGVIQPREPVTAICSAAEIPPALIELFGHAPEEKAHLFPIAVEQSVAGLIYAAGAVESPALELLAQCAAASLAAQGDHARAAEILQKAQEQYPQDRALQDFMKVLSIAPVTQTVLQTDPAVERLMAEAEIYQHKGRSDLASKSWKQVLSVDPQNLHLRGGA